MERILVTGSSGFIGMSLSLSLLKSGYEVIGLDNMNNYYDISLKNARLKRLMDYSDFKFFKGSIEDENFLSDVFNQVHPEKVVNLAAQAGVRYSLQNPQAYVKSNIFGFINVLEQCRQNNVKGLIYASSSSVYGGNKIIPFSEKHNVDKPISIYAVSKIANERMAFTYSHLYGLKTTGLRFFTVYGPWGRPDMAMYIFTKNIIEKKAIDVFNHGDMKRDFTYVDDIVEGLKSAINQNYDCEIFNLGNNHTEDLMHMIGLIEKKLKINAKLNFRDIQPGDVLNTFANIDHAKTKLGYNPKVSIEEGVSVFIDWYRSFHNITA